MKFTLFGSTPSAIQATLTPAPVNPSERAVLALGLSEAVFVVCSASGSSSALPFAPQARGITLGVSEVVADVVDFPFADFLTAATACAGDPPWIRTSGMTFATPDVAFSRAASARETVAERAFTRR